MWVAINLQVSKVDRMQNANNNYLQLYVLDCGMIEYVIDTIYLIFSHRNFGRLDAALIQGLHYSEGGSHSHLFAIRSDHGADLSM